MHINEKSRGELQDCLRENRKINPSFDFTPPPLSTTEGEGGISYRDLDAIRRYNSGREFYWKVTNDETCEGRWKHIPHNPKPVAWDDPAYVDKAKNAKCP